MENKIVRQCVQGLIDDSKMIDTLCDRLDTDRFNLVEVVVDLNENGSGFAFDRMLIEKNIEKLNKALDSAISSAQDASMYADNARCEADNANDSVGYSSDYIDEAKTFMRDIEKAISENNKKVEEAEEAETTCYDENNNPMNN